MLGERGRGGTPCDGLASYLVGVAIHLNIFNMDTRKTEQKVEVSLERGGVGGYLTMFSIGGLRHKIHSLALLIPF